MANLVDGVTCIVKENSYPGLFALCCCVDAVVECWVDHVEHQGASVEVNSVLRLGDGGGNFL